MAWKTGFIRLSPSNLQDSLREIDVAETQGFFTY
jgi:hypothetical protein